MVYKLLTRSDYYDGPLSGLCEFEGQVAWYDCFEMGYCIPVKCGINKCGVWSPRIFRVRKITSCDVIYERWFDGVFNLFKRFRLFLIIYSYCLLDLRHKRDYKHCQIIGAFSDSEYIKSYS